MTNPKTSLEKLRTRNEKVKDLKSALNASRWKWKTIEEDTVKLFNMMDHTCGFCILAMQRRTVDRPNKCPNCPTEIREECNRIQKKTSEIMDEMDQEIHGIRIFLDGLKYWCQLSWLGSSWDWVSASGFYWVFQWVITSGVNGRDSPTPYFLYSVWLDVIRFLYVWTEGRGSQGFSEND